MNPSSHKGAKAVGEPAVSNPAVALPASPKQVLRLLRNVPVLSADALLAWIAYSANQVIAAQVVIAHDAGKYTRGHARALGQAGSLLPDGALREFLALTARTEESVGESIARAGSEWGRTFGRLAFAFPVADRRI